jgi:hypothetical protein
MRRQQVEQREERNREAQPFGKTLVAGQRVDANQSSLGVVEPASAVARIDGRGGL